MLRSRHTGPPAGGGRRTEAPRLRAQEAWDLLLGYAGALTERLVARPPSYETVRWEDAVADMEALFGGAHAVLEEPALAEVEVAAREVLAGTRERDPRGRQWAVDSVLARFCYLACRLLEPEVVVETGVAYGASSAFILRALEENGRGVLHSVDVPPMRGSSRGLWSAVAEVGPTDRWEVHRGSSRRVLRPLLREIGAVDVFLHDSLHTRRNMQREFETAWPHLRPGGILVADDVERNRAFLGLGRWKPAYENVVGDRESRPLSGPRAPVTFGIAIK